MRGIVRDGAALHAPVRNAPFGVVVQEAVNGVGDGRRFGGLPATVEHMRVSGPDLGHLPGRERARLLERQLADAGKRDSTVLPGVMEVQDV